MTRSPRVAALCAESHDATCRRDPGGAGDSAPSPRRSPARALSALFAAALATLTACQATAGSCPGGACTRVATVDHTFPLGTRWRFSVDRCPCEGLVFNDVSFTPKGGVERLVLHRAGIAQLHVPYNAGSPRFHDITVDTDGLGVLAQALAARECDGTLLDGNRVCQELEGRGHAWKYYRSYAMGQEISIWSSSQLGEYNYINRWSFLDDGSIEPELGLTGRLQIYSENPADLRFGSRMNSEAASRPLIAISHMHNAYYRLDFDIAGPANDAVERIAFRPYSSPSCAVGQCSSDAATTLQTETSDAMVCEEFTSWRVYDKVVKNADGRTIGYEIVPGSRGRWSGMVTTTEPWSRGDLWVTAYDPCELLAFDNQPPFIRAECASAAPDLSAMAAGAEPIDGVNLVVWYVNRHRHYVRDEDGPDMPIEWMSFHIEPRSFYYQNPTQ